MLNQMLDNMCTFPETMANLAPGGLRGGWMLEETDAITGVSKRQNKETFLDIIHTTYELTKILSWGPFVKIVAGCPEVECRDNAWPLGTGLSEHAIVQNCISGSQQIPSIILQVNRAFWDVSNDSRG